MEGILYALFPALAWGSLVLVSEKLGGSPYSQTLGISAGALLFAVVMFFINPPELTAFVWLIGIISGIGWALGQANQFKSIKYLGVSKTVPISTGLQLLGTTAFGVLVFKEWTDSVTIIVGLLAVASIITGVLLTNAGKGKDGENETKNPKKGFAVLLLSTAGFVLYVIIVRWFDIDGWSAILPQAAGMTICSIVMGLRHSPFNKYTFRNLLAGVMWASGNIGLLLANPRVGVAVAFALSQTGIIISTLGGIFFLGEKKSKKQIIFISIGCAFVILGGILLGYTKTNN
ncbi:GRP family sugar transporter [Bacillus massiliglaciei]|uniref:GRP family sugar transporter n=1 Tax=Bacillus massiliglaciei TaxID=1816693 RepID=UPI000A5AA6CC|nr:GRP family sugar transporter [Bacillus massiliglaciei]